MRGSIHRRSLPVRNADKTEAEPAASLKTFLDNTCNRVFIHQTVCYSRRDLIALRGGAHTCAAAAVNVDGQYACCLGAQRLPLGRQNKRDEQICALRQVMDGNIEYVSQHTFHRHR